MLVRFDRLLVASSSPDVADVTRAARLLDVGPFRLFELAYERWFGEPAAEKALEKLFMHYLFHEIAPPWVRQFARLVAIEHELGRLDPTEYGLPPRPPETVTVEQLQRFSLAVYVVALAALFWIVPAIAGK